MAATKTDNDETLFIDKVRLRADNLPRQDIVKVLECCAGKGRVWRAVKRLTAKKVEVIPIDNRADLDSFHLHGDNTKVMMGLDLSKFDVIDIDAYGVPYEQLKVVFGSNFTGVVFVTMIQTMMGGIPTGLLVDIGYPSCISEKAPTLGSRNGWRDFMEWLALNGVTEIRHRSKVRKHYLAFKISGAAAPEEDCGIREGGTAADRA